MKPEEIEDLYLRSLDGTLSESQKEELEKALKSNESFAAGLSGYKSIRENILRATPDTFGPYFAQKIIQRIQGMQERVDLQIGSLFRRFQLAAIGVVLALVAINIIFSDELNIQSVLGIQDEAAADDGSDDEEIEVIDFSNNLTNN